MECHYRANIVPIFFVEVLADLHKQVAPDRKAEDMVRSIAGKITGFGSVPNVHHMTLCLGDLLGYPVEQCGVPVLGGGTKSLSWQMGKRVSSSTNRQRLPRCVDGVMAISLGLNAIMQKPGGKLSGNLTLSEQRQRSDLPVNLPLHNLADVKAAADVMAEGRGKRYKGAQPSYGHASHPDELSSRYNIALEKQRRPRRCANLRLMRIMFFASTCSST